MPRVREAVAEALATALPALAVHSIVTTLPPAANVEVGELDVMAGYDLLLYLAAGARVFSSTPQPALLEEVYRRMTAGRGFRPTSRALNVASDHDVVVVQETAQRMLRGLFKPTDCVRVVTAVSELARNIYLYAQTGVVKLELAEEPDRMLIFRVVASDHGPGIAHLEEILAGKYRSRTGLGRGLAGARALLEQLEIQTGPQGTTAKGFKRTRLPDTVRTP